MKKLLLIFLLLSRGSVALQAQTAAKGTLTDVEGHTYPTTVIGKYEWMSENLKTTLYNDGTKILHVQDNASWPQLKNGAFCWPGNNEISAGKYGALYNWYAVNSGKLCPTGWHVPSDEEWKNLEGVADSLHHTGDPVWNEQMGRGYNAGKRLKATSGWKAEGNGTDEFGFSALPSGERTSIGRFFLSGSSTFWWSSTRQGDSLAWYRSIVSFDDNILRNTHPQKIGFSVRCIKEK
jgi:uncharacterized protein (TIGR02145 family)